MKRKRKSPHKHKVRAHKRKGRPVRKYVRGKGRKPAQPVRRRRRVVPVAKKTRKAPRVGLKGGYNIKITYFDADRERFEVDVKDYHGATVAGVEQRDKPKPIRVIRMRRVRGRG